MGRGPHFVLVVKARLLSQNRSPRGVSLAGGPPAIPLLKDSLTQFCPLAGIQLEDSKLDPCVRTQRLLDCRWEQQILECFSFIQATTSVQRKSQKHVNTRYNVCELSPAHEPKT